MADQALLQILPLVTTACVEVTVVEEYERFRQSVGGPEGCVAVIDGLGNCVWTSTEFLDSRVSINAGYVDVPTLQNSLLQVLRDKPDDVAMDDG